MFSLQDSLSFYKAISAIGNQNNNLGTSGDSVHDFSVNLTRPLSENELELLYIQSKLIQKIVDYYPQEATAKELIFKSSDPNLDLSILQTQMKRLSVLDCFREAEIEARIYRDSYLVMEIDDGRDPSMPINFKTLKGISQIKPLLLMPDSTEVYKEVSVYHRIDNMQSIHADRVLAFAGKKLPLRLRRRFRSGENLSTIESIFFELSLYLNASKAASATLTRSGVFVYKMKGFAKAVATVADLLARFEMLNSSMSALKGMVIDADSESVEYISQRLEGYKELIDKFEDQFIAASEYPRSKLLGSSNSSAFSEAGQSDRLEWAQLVAKYQRTTLLPNLQKLIKLICAIEGIDYNLLSIEFESILIETESEIKQSAKTQAELDKLYVEMGVMSADEIKKARFGSQANTTNMMEN